MRKLMLLVAGATMMGFASCDKLKEIAQISVGAQSKDIEFSIPIVPAAGEQDLASENVVLNIDSVIKANNSSVGVNNIKSAKVTGVHLEVLDADQENNLAVIEAAKVILSSDTKTEPTTIAELTGNPDEYKTSIDIPVNDVDLAEYLKSNNYSYTLWAKTRRGTTKEVKCKATISYDLKVGLE
jgi:hypothetical protein